MNKQKMAPALLLSSIFEKFQIFAYRISDNVFFFKNSNFFSKNTFRKSKKKKKSSPKNRSPK